MNQPDLVIFDCDGVLVDSEIIAARVEAELLTNAGYPIDAEEIAERFAGLTFKDIVFALEKESEIPFQASLLDQEQKMLDKRLAAEVRAIEGARDAVSRITSPRAVCSNSSSQRLEMMLTRTGILPLFGDKIFSALNTPTQKPKPAPDVFLHAATRMNADPAKTFVIEDSVHGINGAKAAGMRVIGFTGAAHSWPGHADKLSEAGAETVIRRFADLGPTIAALTEWAE